jgi:hypothetical protein
VMPSAVWVLLVQVARRLMGVIVADVGRVRRTLLAGGDPPGDAVPTGFSARFAQVTHT